MDGIGDSIIKNFRVFCEMCGGKYSEPILPQCIKSRFSITLDIVEGSGDLLVKFVLKITSSEGDEEIFQLNDVVVYNVERISENDKLGTMRYYTLRIETNKGTLSLKRDLKENRLIVSFENRDLSYHSTVIF